MLCRICWLPELVADEQQAQAVVLQHLEGVARHVGLGVAGPGDAELADFLGQRLDAGQVVGQRVVVEEEFLHFGEGGAGIAQLVHHMADGAGAVVVTADRLRPQAEGAAALAAAARVERHVGVLEVPAEVVLDLQVALVDGRDEGQFVHVLEDAAIGIADDHAFPVAIGDAVDLGPVAAVSHFLDGEVEFLAGHEIERRTGFEALHRLDRHLGADEADLQVGLQVAQHLCGLDVAVERGRRGVHHDHVVILHLGRDVGELQLVRGRIDQL